MTRKNQIQEEPNQRAVELVLRGGKSYFTGKYFEIDNLPAEKEKWCVMPERLISYFAGKTWEDYNNFLSEEI